MTPRANNGGAALADTSGLYAILDRADRQHAIAAKSWIELLESDRTVVLHDFVLLEVWSLIQARLGMDAVVVFHRDYLPLMTRISLTEEMVSRGMARCLGAARRDLSLTDCVSFEVASHHGITRAFALDRHFKEAGFLLPGDPSWQK